jgi:gliding motility-associated-like protein
MKYIRKLILLILFSLAYNVQAQHILSNNLVRNPSFEEYYSCPITSGELYKSKYWLGFDTEYYNICNTGWGGVSVPINFCGFQLPKSGNAYAGFVIYGIPFINPPDYRESIKTILQDSLIADKRYCTKLNIVLAEKSYTNGSTCIPLYSIGMLFTKTQVQDSILPICTNCAQVNKSIYNLDTINWVEITGSFFASGGEKYLTIGNFQQTIHALNGCLFITYVFIDDVSVCECSFDINLGADTSLCEGESIILNPMLPNASYIWQDSSHAATYEVKQPGTYWVRAYVADYDITTTDTIVITYKDCSNTIPDLRIPDSFTPNGDGLNDKFEYFYAEYYDITTLIYNRWGQLLFQSQNTDFWDGKYKGKTVTFGTYIYHIEAIRKDTQEKKIHCGKITVL